LVKEEWSGYDPSLKDYASLQFAEALKKVKKAVTTWASKKYKESNKELKEVEFNLYSLYEKISREVFTKAKRERVKYLENARQKLLEKR
jgi:hypothetical protein